MPIKTSRRHTDISKWRTPWFSRLSDKAKIAHLYILDNCDNAGVWDGNTVAADLELGWSGEKSPDWRSIMAELSAEVVPVAGGKWWVKRHIQLQEGIRDGSEMNDQHFRYVPIFRSLREHGLLETFKELNPSITFVSRKTRPTLQEIKSANT